MCDITAVLKEGDSVKNKFFTREFVPVAQRWQVMEKAW